MEDPKSSSSQDGADLVAFLLRNPIICERVLKHLPSEDFWALYLCHAKVKRAIESTGLDKRYKWAAAGDWAKLYALQSLHNNAEGEKVKRLWTLEYDQPPSQQNCKRDLGSGLWLAVTEDGRKLFLDVSSSRDFGWSNDSVARVALPNQLLYKPCLIASRHYKSKTFFVVGHKRPPPDPGAKDCFVGVMVDSGCKNPLRWTTTIFEHTAGYAWGLCDEGGFCWINSSVCVLKLDADGQTRCFNSETGESLCALVGPDEINDNDNMTLITHDPDAFHHINTYQIEQIDFVPWPEDATTSFPRSASHVVFDEVQLVNRCYLFVFLKCSLSCVGMRLIRCDLHGILQTTEWVVLYPKELDLEPWVERGATMIGERWLRVIFFKRGLDELAYRALTYDLLGKENVELGLQPSQDEILTLPKRTKSEIAT